MYHICVVLIETDKVAKIYHTIDAIIAILVLFVDVEMMLCSIHKTLKTRNVSNCESESKTKTNIENGNRAQLGECVCVCV